MPQKIVLVSTAAHKKQFSSALARVHIIEIDIPFVFDVEIGRIVVIQNEIMIEIKSTDSVIFIPFHSPLESVVRTKASNTTQNVMSFLCAIKNCCNTIRNDPFLWLSAYDKTSLIRLSSEFPVIPETILCTEPDRWRKKWERQAFIIKSGYGVRKARNGKHVQATLLFGDVGLTEVPKHRYELQKYIRPTKEIRTYTTRSHGICRVVSLEMPTGTELVPDWRDEMLEENFNVSKYVNDDVNKLSADIIKKLGMY